MVHGLALLPYGFNAVQYLDAAFPVGKLHSEKPSFGFDKRGFLFQSLAPFLLPPFHLHVPPFFSHVEAFSYTHLANYLALEYVPKHLKTDRLCGMALERDPLAIRFFNPEQLTPEVLSLIHI